MSSKIIVQEKTYHVEVFVDHVFVLQVDVCDTSGLFHISSATVRFQSVDNIVKSCDI
jgi:hypothetical protein